MPTAQTWSGCHSRLEGSCPLSRPVETSRRLPNRTLKLLRTAPNASNYCIISTIFAPQNKLHHRISMLFSLSILKVSVVAIKRVWSTIVSILVLHTSPSYIEVIHSMVSQTKVTSLTSSRFHLKCDRAH